MKKVLFAGLLALAGVSVSAQNLIKNEKFATEVKTKVTNANKATAGEWFIMNNEADGVTTIAWEETGDAKYPNAMKLIWSTVLESWLPGEGEEFPKFVEAPHGPVADPDLFTDDNSFLMTTGRRQGTYFHSEHRQLPWCRELWPVPRLEMNPVDAERLGLEQGDWVWIDPGRMVADRVVRTARDAGFEGKASVWFYETPEESVSSTERHWVVGMQFEEESPTVFARGYGIEGLPVASYRVLTAMPYAGEKVWRPETRRCGRYDYPAGATADSWTYEALNSLDAFPAELAEAARATLAESGK